MNYDTEIARLIDLNSEKMARLTGKPEHRKKAARNLLALLASDLKKLVREQTLQFYEGKGSPSLGPNAPLFPSIVPVPQPTTTTELPDVHPPFVG